MDGWMEDRKEGRYEITLEWNTNSAMESFWMVRFMHAGALDVFRNYYVRYTYIH